MFRFRLIELLMAVTVFSLAALALSKASPLAVCIVSTVVYVVLLAATIVALAGAGKRRVFCLGFVVGALSYLGLLHFVVGAESGNYQPPRLLTSRVLALLYFPTRTTNAMPPPNPMAPSNIPPMIVPTYTAPTTNYEPSPTPDDGADPIVSADLAPAPSPSPPAVDASTSSFGWDPYDRYGTPMAPTYFQPTDARRIAFFDIGQQFWALAIGIFAGWAARIVYARRRPETAAA